jgi:fucose permease
VASSIAIVGVLFFLIGFFTWLNGPLITFVKLAFDSRGRRLPGADGVLPVLFLPRIACRGSSPHRHEEGAGLSLVVMAAGRRCSASSPPSAGIRGVGGLFVIGSGLALLQTAVNPYISILGPIETRRGASR